MVGLLISLVLRPPLVALSVPLLPAHFASSHIEPVVLAIFEVVDGSDVSIVSTKRHP